MVAIQEENVDVHFTPVVSCTEDGVVGEDGVERKVDTVGKTLPCRIFRRKFLTC